MNDLYPDFVSGNERWKVERALDLVNAYAAGYIANSGLHGGIGPDAFLGLFTNAYRCIQGVEKFVKEGKPESL